MSDQLGLRLLAQLERLRTEAEAVNARLSAGLNPDLRYIGRDADRLVQVTIDGLGRTTDVSVSPTWRQTTDAPGLQQAMIAAIRDSERQRLEGWATAATAAGPTSATVPPSGFLVKESPGASGLNVHSGVDLVRTLLPLFEAAEQQLADLAPRFQEHLEAPVEISSPAGEIIARMKGGAVVEIELRPRFTRVASTDDIAHRVCRLLQDAHDRTWREIGDFLPQELGTLMSFAAESEQMLRQLGLNT